MSNSEIDEETSSSELGEHQFEEAHSELAPESDIQKQRKQLSSAALNEQTKAEERLWVFITVGAFAAALLTSLIVVPVFNVQLQRQENVFKLHGEVNLIEASARQALSISGNFDALRNSLRLTENEISKLSQPQTLFQKMATWTFGSKEKSNNLNTAWAEYRAIAEELLAKEAEINALKKGLFRFSSEVNQSIGETVQFVETVAKEGQAASQSSKKDKYLILTSEATNLNGILSRVSAAIRQYYAGNLLLPKISDNLNALLLRLQETLERVVSNSGTAVAATGETLENRYSELQVQLLTIGEYTQTLVEAQRTKRNLKKQSETLLQALEEVDKVSPKWSVVGRLINLLPILFALIGVYTLWRFFGLQNREHIAHEEIISETLAEQQESILKLLDEMSALADGDLSVEAEVTDQITGAIADSVNFAVLEMRELVGQINRASIEVAKETELAVESARSVSRSNMQQAEEITSAAKLMQRVSNSMRDISVEARDSSAMAAESTNAASQGAHAVSDTIKGMEDIREQIQDTSKRIKRLGESSQRIGDIVELINDIAEQTNILSLNAAIQASMAGEAGRGFAVVADEVQSLAERSTDATKKITELVTTIQNDTNDAVLSMEEATQQVVGGTKVADSAGNALAGIEDISQRLSNLIDGIAKASSQQAEVVTKVSQQVSRVSETSSETSRKSQNSADAIAKLLELSRELDESVSRFKLPKA